MRKAILAACAIAALLLTAGVLGAAQIDLLYKPHIKAGELWFPEGEALQNNTDDILCFEGQGGTDNTDLCLDLDGTSPVLYSATDTALTISDDLLLSGDFDVTLGAADNVVIDGDTTNQTQTDGTFRVNTGTVTAGVHPLHIAVTTDNGTAAGTDTFAAQFIVTCNDADADCKGVLVQSAATANAAANSYEYLLLLDSQENTAGAVPDALLITDSGGIAGGIVDAIDVSSANIDNAINVGSNDITGVSYGVEASTALVLGDLLTGTDGATVAIYSSDWEIGTAGDMTGIGGIVMNGSLAMTGANLDLDPTGTFDLSMDAAQSAQIHVSDNLATAFVIEETVGGDDYLVVNTGNAAEAVSIGNAVTNPLVHFLGTGAVDVDGAFDVEGATTLDQVTIDTADGAFAVGGANNMTVTVAAIDLDPTGNVTLDMDAARTVTFTLADNSSGAFRVQEAANIYLDVDTGDADANLLFGNATIDPDFVFQGDGDFDVQGLFVRLNSDAVAATAEEPYIQMLAGDGVVAPNNDIVRMTLLQDPINEYVEFFAERSRNGGGYADIAPVLQIGETGQIADLDPLVRFVGGTGAASDSATIAFDGVTGDLQIGTGATSVSAAVNLDAEAGLDVTGTLTQGTGNVALTADAASSFTTSAGALTLTSADTATWSVSGDAVGALTLTIDAINAGAGTGVLAVTADDTVEIGDAAGNPAISLPGTGTLSVTGAGDFAGDLAVGDASTDVLMCDSATPADGAFEDSAILRLRGRYDPAGAGALATADIDIFNDMTADDGSNTLVVDLDGGADELTLTDAGVLTVSGGLTVSAGTVNLPSGEIGAAEIADTVCMTMVVGSGNPTEASATDDYVGFGTQNALNAAEAVVDFYVIPVGGTIHNLRAVIDVAPGVGNDPWAVTLRDDAVNTAVTCTIDEAATSCTDAVNTAAVLAGSKLTALVSSAGADADPAAAAEIVVSFCIGQ